MVDSIGNAIKTKKEVTNEFVIHRTSGKVFWVKLTVWPFMDSAGNVLQLYGALLDVSADHEVIERYNAFTSHLNGGMHICYLSDPCHLAYASTNLCSLLGYTREEFDREIGESYDILVVDEDLAAFKGFVKRLTDNQFRDAVNDASSGAYVLMTDSQQANMDTSMRAIETSILLIVALSVIIGLVIVYNMTELSISERRREYATLLVLGAGGSRIAWITLMESLGELIVALIIGCPIAHFAASRILDGMCSVGMQFPVVQAGTAMLIAVLITLVYVVTATFFAQLRVHRWDPVSVLNSED